MKVGAMWSGARWEWEQMSSYGHVRFSVEPPAHTGNGLSMHVGRINTLKE